ncbi:MAG: HEAT repeat domain-containing protein [Dehalococcoidia bacterium]|nr:HEAT repeat domain-containing protein [Dehalococcoidia bacterium]
MSESDHQEGTLAEILLRLRDDAQDPSYPLLSGLSDLSTGERRLFGETWGHLSTERKRIVLSRLTTLAEDNVEYDFGAVFKHALNDDDDAVRQKAIEGLWESEESSLINPLLGLFASDRSIAVREAAATALGRFAVLAECHKISAEHIARLSQSMLAAVNNPAEPLPLRCRTLEAVAPFSLATVTQAIWAAYRHDEPEMHASAIKAMGINRDLLWLPTILQEFASDRPEIRHVAAEAAGALGEAEAAGPLGELLGDADSKVRLAAAEALGNIGGAEAKRALKPALRHKDQSLRKAAIDALAEIEFFEEPFSPHHPV